MPFAEYESYDGLGLAELVANDDVKPEELLDAAIERADARNPVLNAIDLPPSFVPRFKLVLGRLAAAGRLRAAAPRGWVGRGAGSRGRCGAAAGCIPAASVR